MNQLRNIHECAFGFSQRAPKSRQSIINHATFLEGSGFDFGSGYAKRDWRLEIEVPLFVSWFGAFVLPFLAGLSEQKRS